MIRIIANVNCNITNNFLGVTNAFAALKEGVKQVIIGHAADLADLIKGSAGTTITNG